MKNRKTYFQNSIWRLVLSVLFFLVQFLWLWFLGVKLKKYAVLINLLTSIIATLLSMIVFSKGKMNSNFKLFWIMIILILPVFGIMLYCLFNHKLSTKAINYLKDVQRICKESLDSYNRGRLISDDVDVHIKNQLRYLSSVEGFPLYRGDDVRFYSDASDAFNDILIDAEKAKKSIHLEYFAIEDKKSFGQLFDILKRKVEQGLDVKIMYDDIGSIGFLNSAFIEKMKDVGIECRTFNKITPVIHMYMNNRDHRKVAIFDDKIAYTGGFNIADEYFNISSPFGYWKDTGVRICGPAVASFRMMFLEMWSISGREYPESAELVHDATSVQTEKSGYILPYADSPFDDAFVGENVYLNLIKAAKNKVYITTPYLIISDEMENELQLAAKRGVDIRIVTPGIPDKKVIFRLTRSYYHNLVSSGVNIYEYTPGFIHSKQIIVDDEIACVGTINFDYRSLFLHFENAVLLYGVRAIDDIAKDFEQLFEASCLVNQLYLPERNLGQRVVDCTLNLIAPLL